MNRQQIQELCENIFLAALNGGELSGIVFRHNDTPQKAQKDMVVITAGAPQEMLYGARPWRVEIDVEMKSNTAGRCAVIHGAALDRLKDSLILRSAALTAGLREDDTFDIYHEEMSGDRSETKNLRKRSITIPIEVAIAT